MGYDRPDIRLTFALASLLLIHPHTLPAQTSLRIHDDNDFFDFWNPIATRPDVDYSQGLHIALTWPAATPHILRWLGTAKPCNANTPLTERCSRISTAAGQDIYTPWYDIPPDGIVDHPYAGFLYLRGEVRQESDRRLDAFSVTFGVTGPPSLAGAAQNAIHKLFGFRTVDGWSTQIPFEPGVIINYEAARQLLGANTGALGIRFVPRWNVRVGTITTNADLGAELIAGLRPPAPWSTPRQDFHHPLSLFARASVVGAVVLRDEFLDGSLFSSSARVEKKRFVGVASAGVGIRIGRVMIEWQAHDQGLTYESQPEPHLFSTLSITVH